MYNLIHNFPSNFINEKGKQAWPDKVGSLDAKHAILMTVDDKNEDCPIINFSFTGDPEKVAKHLLNSIMLNKDLAMAILRDLSDDDAFLNGLVQNYSDN